MTDVPGDLKYLSSHEWIRVEDSETGVVGITDHAQEAMGDLVYVELPEVGAKVSAGDQVAVVESVKAASDIYTPVSGEIVAVNEALEDSPESVNTDAYGDGWIFQVRMDDIEEMNDLLGPSDYQAQIDEEDSVEGVEVEEE